MTTELTLLAQHVSSSEQLRAVVQVLAHRVAQDTQWGGAEHDDEHQISEFFTFILDQIDKAILDQFNGDGFPAPGGGYHNPQRARERLKKIAALAIAAMESLDRRGLAR